MRRKQKLIKQYFLNSLSLSYDGHIHLNGFPFLDSKEDFTHDTLVCDVMKPQPGDPPLETIDLSKCTVGE